MLRYRLLFSVLFITALAAFCRFDALGVGGAPPGLWLFPLALALSLLAAGEMIWLAAARNLRPLPWVVYLGNLTIVASNGIPLFWADYRADSPLERLGWPLATFTVWVLLAFVGELRRYEKPGQATVDLAVAVLSLAYVGLPLGFLMQLRALEYFPGGLVALVSLIAVVKAGDTGAYTAGRLFGWHKMTPILSPGKTWEGAAGAAIAAPLAAYATLYFMLPASERSLALNNWNWLIFGLAVGLAGLVGDLAESLLKRDLGRKDSSAYLAGFGGVLDLLDSIFFAAPVAYLIWIAQWA